MLCEQMHRTSLSSLLGRILLSTLQIRTNAYAHTEANPFVWSLRGTPPSTLVQFPTVYSRESSAILKNPNNGKVLVYPLSAAACEKVETAPLTAKEAKTCFTRAANNRAVAPAMISPVIKRSSHSLF